MNWRITARLFIKSRLRSELKRAPLKSAGPAVAGFAILPLAGK
jgi:hypothetical protein